MVNFHFFISYRTIALKSTLQRLSPSQPHSMWISCCSSAVRTAWWGSKVSFLSASWTVKPQTLQLTTSAERSSQKHEQKVIFTISSLLAAEGSDPKASACVPVAAPDNPNCSYSVQQQSEVGETKQFRICIDVLFMLWSIVSVARGVAW